MKKSSHEILAPVGNFEMAQAAVHNGAGAIYIGAPGLNARGRTIDFSLEEITELIEFCHLRGTKVFIALNVLIFERELQSLENYLRKLIALGPDAFIIQDIGLVRLIKQIAPDQVIHASTQMTVSSYEAIHETSDLDLKRYVLSREMSLEEIEEVRKNTEKELEVFVHGALCVSYSGQCLTSESFGGRSANRGQCAQSCRLEYDIFVDGEQRDLGSQQYLFSPQDLCGIDEVKELHEIGVDCFKIEGRLKSPQYVASTVGNFHRVLEGSDTARWDELESTYSRGLYPGWLHGVKHQELVDGTFSNNQGLKAGVTLGKFIQSKKGPQIQVELIHALEPGDGVLFFHRSSGRKWGAKIYSVEGSLLGLSRDTSESDLNKVHSGWEIYRNSSPQVDQRLQKSWTDKTLHKKLDIEIELSLKYNQPLELSVKGPEGQFIEVSSETLVEESRGQSLTQEQIIKSFGGLGQEPYSIKSFDIHKDDSIWVQNKALRQLKQSAITKLNELRSTLVQKCRDVEIEFPTDQQTPEEKSLLNVLVRKENQIDDLGGLNINTIIMDFEFGKDYKIGMDKIAQLGYKRGIATLRVYKPNEHHHLKVIKWLKPEVILVRNLGALNWLKENMDLSETELIGDFSLNVTNSMTAEWMIQHGLETLQPAHDCNKEQLLDLIQQFGPRVFEIPLHHYMPTFHMEHCVFAAFLSQGNSVKDCGKVCEHHEVEVRDHKGVQHFLKSDQECRNTMFNGQPQSASRIVDELRSFGIQQFRLEALLEDSKSLASKVEVYSQLISGELNADQVFQKLGVIEKYGVTEGQLFNNTPFQDRKKERTL